MSIWTDISSRYRRATPLLRLVYIDVGLFLALRVVALVSVLMGVPAEQLIKWVEMPSTLEGLARQPWTAVSYMFFHYDVLHILFNMLWLYWLGRIFLEYFNSKQLVGLYLMGGLCGGALYLAAYATLPYFAHQPATAYLIGASASILAIVVAVAVYAPDYRIGLLMLGDISLKWVAIITIVILMLGTGEAQMGAQAAHLGGALVGVAYGLAMRRGHDITAWLNACLDSMAGLFKRRRGPGRPAGGRAFHYQANRAAAPSPQGPSEAEIDAILDKLKRSGYGALSDKEKETLFKASSNYKSYD